MAAKSPNSKSANTPTILHVLDNLAVGGAQRMFVRYISSACPSRESVVLVSRQNTSWEQAVEKANVPLSFLPSSRLSSLATWFAAYRLLRADESDFVHVHMQYATLIFLPVARLLGRKTIVTLHTTGALGGKLRARVKFQIERFVIRRFASHVISVGKGVTDAWKERLREQNIITIPNAVPLVSRPTEADRRRIRNDLGLSQDAVVLITVASLTPKKNLALLIDALALAFPHDREWQHCIVGRGSEQPALERRVKAVGLQRNVKLLGAREDIDALLFASDVFVLSSIQEGLPIAMLEAMATGLPVISTDVGDVATVATQDVALLVPNGDLEALAHAIEKLVSNSELRCKMGEAARAKIVAQFNQERWISSMRKAYLDFANEVRVGVTHFSASGLHSDTTN